MARGISVTIPSALGRVQLYADPRQVEKATELIKSTPEILTKAYNISANRYAERIVRTAKSCIAHGIPPRGSGVSWPPHAASTVKRLGAHTLLYWSHQYYHHIKVIRRGKHIAVGVPSSLRKTRPDHYRSSSPITLSRVAKILELGSEDGKIPARPLWRYLWPSVGGSDSYEKDLVKEIRKQISLYK